MEGDKVYLTGQSCYVVIENHLNQWLFVHRQNTGYQDGRWGLPGGHVQPGEQIHVAAAREVQEEVGITIEPRDLILSFVMQRNKIYEHIDDRLDIYFSAIKWSGHAVNKEPDRHSAIGWHDPNNLPANIVDFIGVACVGIAHGENFDTFGWENTLQ